MIPVSRLMTSVRYAVKDMQGVTFSDHEIIEALNVAARLLFERLGARFVWPALKRTVIVVDHGRGTLPMDFHNIRKLTMDGGELRPVTGRPAEGQYRIAGVELYGPDGGYGLEYWYIPAPVADPSKPVMRARPAKETSTQVNRTALNRSRRMKGDATTTSAGAM